jgi:hypothetical protein
MYLMSLFHDFSGGIMPSVTRIVPAMAGALTMLLILGLAARPDDRAALLKVREEVWQQVRLQNHKSLLSRRLAIAERS